MDDQDCERCDDGRFDCDNCRADQWQETASAQQGPPAELLTDLDLFAIRSDIRLLRGGCRRAVPTFDAEADRYQRIPNTLKANADELTAQRQATVKAMDRVHELEQTIKETVANQVDQAARIVAQQARINELEGQRDSLQELANGSVVTISVRDMPEVQEMLRRASETERKNQELLEQFAALRDQYGAAQQLWADLGANLRGMEDSRDFYREKFAASVETIQGLREEVSGLKGVMAEDGEHIAELKEQLGELTTRFANQGIDLNAYRNRAINQSATIARLQKLEHIVQPFLDDKEFGWTDIAGSKLYVGAEAIRNIRRWAGVNANGGGGNPSTSG